MAEYQQLTDLPEQLRLADEIVLLIGPRLHGYLHHRCSDPEFVKEVYSTTLRAVADVVPAFKGREGQGFASFCFGIVRHKFLDALRRKAREKEDPMDMDNLGESAKGWVQVASLAPGGRLDLEYALNLLRRAKPLCYDYLWLRYMEKMKYKTMAAALGMETKAVEKATNRCLKLANELMADEA